MNERRTRSLRTLFSQKASFVLFVPPVAFRCAAANLSIWRVTPLSLPPVIVPRFDIPRARSRYRGTSSSAMSLRAVSLGIRVPRCTVAGTRSFFGLPKALNDLTSSRKEYSERQLLK